MVLLYAQTVSSLCQLTLCQLTIDHVARNGDRVLRRLGSRPITAPAPLDALPEELVATRRNGALLPTHNTWLFPGRTAGQPLHESRLVNRLWAMGARPRLSRNTALFTVAAETPAAVLAAMLGLRIQVAVRTRSVVS